MTIRRCCAALAIGVIAIAVLRIYAAAPVSTSERGESAVASAVVRGHVVQAPHIDAALGSIALVAMALLSSGLVQPRRGAVVPAAAISFRRRGPPPTR